MKKVNEMNAAFLKARMSKDKTAIGVLSALKGEYENSIKNGNPEGDVTLEIMVKKFVKNLEIVGTPESKAEIEIIKPFGAPEVDMKALSECVKNILLANIPKVIEYNEGKQNVIGFFTGNVIKTFGRVDGKIAIEVIKDEISKIHVGIES